MTYQQSSSFGLLDERIRRWIWSEGWTELRDAQEQAIRAIINADSDVIIAAATAAGKTEAAFLPILTHMLKHGEEIGLVLYISPLKALINDQFGRLERLCESLNVPVWPWHGDISSSLKTRFIKAPSGVLLITPESLEALFCNRGTSVSRLFANLRYIVVDELHAFIGSERGKQLQSLMHRIDDATEQSTPRIGLSATLGDMALAADFLRQRSVNTVRIIESKSSGGQLKILVKGHIEHIPLQVEDEEAVQPTAMDAVAEHLFQALRGSNNLVFPNSRANVEQYTYQLRKLCEAARVPNEFWPHHGNLSREIREETEQALRSNERCATAICTNTLELGIDIGAVKSIAQIGPPPSVASLRQRLGRSGRRKGEPAILRGYAVEPRLEAKSHVMTQLREQLFELCAMVTLLLDGWFEPPRTGGMHLSTLVQQLLSLIAQRGGIMASAAFKVLCSSGPFVNVSKSDFVELLRSLGTKELIQQDTSGLLLHGARGEALVNHYTFYASFTSEEEFRIIAGNKTLGSLPISSAVTVGELILFAGQTWLIEDINEDSKTIYVVQHKAGRPPTFSSHGGQVHPRIRKRMRELYASSEPLRFLDPVAAQLFSEGQETYRRYRLEAQSILQTGGTLLLFTWLGDAENESIAAALRTRGFSCMPVGPAIEVSGPHADANRLSDVLGELGEQTAPTPGELLGDAQNLAVEKWDWTVPGELLMRNYASHRLDISNAWKWLSSIGA